LIKKKKKERKENLLRDWVIERPELSSSFNVKALFLD